MSEDDRGEVVRLHGMDPQGREATVILYDLTQRDIDDACNYYESIGFRFTDVEIEDRF